MWLLALMAIILAVTHNVYSICNYLLPSHSADGLCPMKFQWFPTRLFKEHAGHLVDGRPWILGIKPKTFQTHNIYTISVTTAPPCEWVVQ